MILIFLCCLPSLIPAYQHLEQSRANVREAFREFESEFQKHYAYADLASRLRRFKLSYKEVMEQNNLPHPDYYREINKFSAMEDYELDRYLGLGNFTATPHNHSVDEETLEPRATIPDQVDHVTSGIVTPVKDQLSCGGCWAFAAVGSFESAYAETTGYLKSFSEQEALDCTYPDTRDGCQGGWYYDTFSYLKTNQRLAKYNDMPYTGSDGPCVTTSLPTNAIKNLEFTGHIRVAGGDRSVQAALSKRVLAVGTHANTMFSYRSGIFTGCPQNAGAAVNHAMLLTGYTPLYWSLKNSWGRDWGENGYIRISRDISQDGCRITGYAYYPTVSYTGGNGVEPDPDEDDVYQEEDDVNIARGGVTSQSSTSWNGASEHAVDGNTSNDFYEGFCSRTKIGYITYWNVKLNTTATVKKVVIHLRSDCASCLADIDGTTVHVGDRGDYWDKQCGAQLDSSFHDNFTLTVNCKLTGKYVSLDKLSLSAPKALTVCEVLVYEHDGDDCIGGNVKCDDGLCRPPSFC